MLLHATLLHASDVRTSRTVNVRASDLGAVIHGYHNNYGGTYFKRF